MAQQTIEQDCLKEEQELFDLLHVLAERATDSPRDENRLADSRACALGIMVVAEMMTEPGSTPDYAGVYARVLEGMSFGPANQSCGRVSHNVWRRLRSVYMAGVMPADDYEPEGLLRGLVGGGIRVLGADEQVHKDSTHC